MSKTARPMRQMLHRQRNGGRKAVCKMKAIASMLTVQGGDDLIRMLFPRRWKGRPSMEAYQSGDILVFNDDHVI